MCIVLLVDDDSQQLALRKLLLKAAAHDVAIADSVEEAMRLLEEVLPDVLLTDLRLPKLKDGLSLIRAARERLPAAKIIVLSGWPEELCDLPEEKLVWQVLGKPIRHEHLLAAINAAACGPGRSLPSAAS